MAHDVGNGRQNLLDGELCRLAHLFRVTRLDGTVLRVTDHDGTLTFTEGWIDGDTDPFTSENTYSPVDGWDASNERAEAAMKRSNIEFRGAIGGSIVTTADLQAGLWHDAAVDEVIVDWMYPWLGPIRWKHYRLTDFRFDGDVWMAQCENRMGELHRKVGKVFSKTCWHGFGDSRCGINASASNTTMFSSTVTAVTTNADFKFEGTGGHTPEDQADDFFKVGHLTWTSGNNKGRSYPVYQSYQKTGSDPGTSDDARLVLQYPTAATIQVGDGFTVYAGCDRTLAECSTKWSNLVNFGGFPQIPGTSAVAKTGEEVAG